MQCCPRCLSHSVYTKCRQSCCHSNNTSAAGNRTCASVKLRTSLTGLFPATSAPLVDQYLAANGIILGKANLGELQSGGATNPTVSGTNSEGFVYNITTALNPYDPTRTAQGTFSRKPLNSMVSSYLQIRVYCACTSCVGCHCTQVASSNSVAIRLTHFA